MLGSARGVKRHLGRAMDEFGRLGDSGNLLTLLVADAPLDARPSPRSGRGARRWGDEHRAKHPGRVSGANQPASAGL